VDCHRRLRCGVWLIAAVALMLCGCSAYDTPDLPMWVRAGDRDIGRHLTYAYGCGSCHDIPGVRGAEAMVGPTLESFARRSYVAGTLPNTPSNLIRFIVAPQEIDPGSAMPSMGVSEEHARHIAAYLYTLR
jgi:cytochrome c